MAFDFARPAILVIAVLCIFACSSEQKKFVIEPEPPIEPPIDPEETIDFPRVLEGEQRPNIVFIMSDDHAVNALSAYGSDIVATPNIDRIAHDGVLFSNAFVTNSLCSPSRATALTGKLSHLNSVRGNTDVFNSEQQTLPKLLQAQGYETAIYGKWHLKSEPTGFDFWEVLPNQGRYYRPDFRTPTGQITEEGYVTDVITDKVLDYLENKRDIDKPFFLMYQHKAPHRQWWPALSDLEQLREKVFAEPSTFNYSQEGRGEAAKSAEMSIASHMALSMDNKIWPRNLPEGYREHLSFAEQEFRANYALLNADQKQIWDETYIPINDEYMMLDDGELSSWKFQRYLQDYTAVIKSVDRNVGRVLDYLEANGLAENTIVIYTSDQGFYLGEFGWFDKRFMYEPSLRTPFVMKWPAKISENTLVSSFVQNLDFAPTLLSALSLEVPEDMQGRNAMQVVNHTPEDWRNEIYYHYYDYPAIHMVKKHYGIRTERYKLIHFYDDIDEWELYDLVEDPLELNNVYGQDVYVDVQSTLHEKLEQMRIDYEVVD